MIINLLLLLNYYSHGKAELNYFVYTSGKISEKYDHCKSLQQQLHAETQVKTLWNFITEVLKC